MCIAWTFEHLFDTPSTQLKLIHDADTLKSDPGRMFVIYCHDSTASTSFDLAALLNLTPGIDRCWCDWSLLEFLTCASFFQTSATSRGMIPQTGSNTTEFCRLIDGASESFSWTVTLSTIVDSSMCSAWIEDEWRSFEVASVSKGSKGGNSESKKDLKGHNNSWSDTIQSGFQTVHCPYSTSITML